MAWWFTKKLRVPVSNHTHLVEAVQMWEVRWYSRHGKFSSDIKPELECFTTEADANAFALSLRAARRLLRHTEDLGVTVSKAQSAE